MKKIISLLTIFALLFSFVSVDSANAQPMPPHPIGGHVTYQDAPQIGVEVVVTNLRTSESSSTITNYAGAYQVELANLPNAYFPEDEVKVAVLGQEKTITIEGGSDTVDFLLESAQNKECPDGSVIPIDDECPEVEVPEVVEETVKVSSNADETEASFDVAYGEEFEVKVANNKLVKLLDKEIKFDGNDYDVSEYLYLKGTVKTSIDDIDYLEPTFVLDKKAVEYRYVFDNPIDIDNIDEEDELEINFAGKRLKIVEVKSNEFVYETGVEKTINVGEVLDGVELLKVGNGVVRVKVGEVEENIDLGQLRLVNEVEVYVKELWPESNEVDAATLIVGDDIKRTVTKGDSYIEDVDDWVYDFEVVDDELVSISLLNKNDYTEVEDDDYLALKVGDKLVLPNEFLEVKFNSVTEYESVELNFELDEGYLYVEGSVEDSFVIGTEEYDELWIKDDGFYDGDFELLTTEDVRIGDSEVYLKLGESVTIGKLTILTDLSDILYDGVSFATKDDDFIGHSGVAFENPEQAIENEDFTVFVPNTDDDIEASFVISKYKSDELVEGEDPVVVVDLCKDITCLDGKECKKGVCVDKVVITPDKPDVIEPDKVVPPDDTVKPVEPEGSLAWLWITLAILIVLGIIGYVFKKK